MSRIISKERENYFYSLYISVLIYSNNKLNKKQLKNIYDYNNLDSQEKIFIYKKQSLC